MIKSEKREAPATEMNRQQICVALGVSESTVRRLEQAGLPFTPVGPRSKRYNFDECKTWLRDTYRPVVEQPGGHTSAANLSRIGREFSESCRKVRLRVTPSS
jgi:hypothetical protein